MVDCHSQCFHHFKFVLVVVEVERATSAQIYVSVLPLGRLVVPAAQSSDNTSDARTLACKLLAADNAATNSANSGLVALR